MQFPTLVFSLSVLLGGCSFPLQRRGHRELRLQPLVGEAPRSDMGRWGSASPGDMAHAGSVTRELLVPRKVLVLGEGGVTQR